LDRQSTDGKELIMGVVDEAKGKAKEAVGDVTGDQKLKTEGQVDRGKGKVKDAVDKVADKITGK
jgi:uncharacterized protein YjbJ (UPF0337 family)